MWGIRGKDIQQTVKFRSSMIVRKKQKNQRQSAENLKNEFAGVFLGKKTMMSAFN